MSRYGILDLPNQLHPCFRRRLRSTTRDRQSRVLWRIRRDVLLTECSQQVLKPELMPIERVEVVIRESALLEWNPIEWIMLMINEADRMRKMKMWIKIVIYPNFCLITFINSLHIDAHFQNFGRNWQYSKWMFFRINVMQATD